ncbi:hypothetical protein ACFQZE_16170 [Paenibacillus sp. GCM10027627]|uniref:hypothetical protein n=1 Tax=unclassified Paenibacillus TaxID=185978 RepID=UPI00363A880B
MISDKGLDGCLEQMPALVRIDDYQMERMLIGETCFNSSKPSHRDVTWKQLVHFSACHCVNDVLSENSGEELDLRLNKAANRRWSNRHYRFHSSEHYLQVRCMVMDHLLAFLQMHPLKNVMVLFEQMTAYIEELDMEMVQNFHIVAFDGGDASEHYNVQKYVVEEGEEALELYARMTTLFCMSAFGRLPVQIEAFSLLSGKRYAWAPNYRFWRESLDYMALIKSLLPNPISASNPIDETLYSH